MATAVTACARWGLKARYVGKIGDDSAGRLQQDEMLKAGIEAHWIVAPDCQSQSSFILVDEETGERQSSGSAILGWNCFHRRSKREWVVRPDCFMWMATIAPGRPRPLAGLARRGFLLPPTWTISTQEWKFYLRMWITPLLPGISRRGFAERTTCSFPCRHGFPVRMPVTAATLGADGVLAWDGSRDSTTPRRLK